MAKTIGRIGLVARGVVYCIIAGLALRIAAGDFERADNRGALETILRQPLSRVTRLMLAFGPAMLAVVALGLFCFGLSFVEARYRKIHQA